MLRFTSNQQARMLAERVNVRSWGNYVGRSQSKGRYQATRFDLHYVHFTRAENDRNCYDSSLPRGETFD